MIKRYEKVYIVQSENSLPKAKIVISLEINVTFLLLEFLIFG